MADDNPRFTAADADSETPPRVNPLFHWTRETWGLALRAAPLDAHAQHLFTSAQLRLPAQASHDQRERAWRAVAASLGASRDRFVRVRQVHGRGVRVVEAQDGPPDPALLPDGDAIVSNLSGAILAVVVADCVPLLLVDPRAGCGGRHSCRLARHLRRRHDGGGRGDAPGMGHAAGGCRRRSRTEHRRRTITRSVSRWSRHSHRRGMPPRSIAGSRDAAACCVSISGARTSISWRRQA